MNMGNTTAQEDFALANSAIKRNLVNRGTLDQPKPLLKFHTVCGENVQLLKEGQVARRKESFCKGLAFSNRPININEMICLRLNEISVNWSGVLRFGVTNVDPASFRDITLPKFVCPDLTSKAGYWAKALAERYSTYKSILHFTINSDGELHYGLNGVKKGLFLNGINVSLPLWIVVDIYGNSIAVEFIDSSILSVELEKSFMTKISSENNVERLTSVIEFFPDLGASLDLNSNSTKSIINSTAELLNNAVPSPIFTSTKTLSITEPILQFQFHYVKGLNIKLHHNDTIASRKNGEYYLGYVFTNRPILINELLTIKILQTDDSFSGSLAFGLTSCDPANISITSLPIDSDKLLERAEYWVCIKDVAVNPKMGDKLTFKIDKDGKVLFCKNKGNFRVIVHVDVSVKLWGFFDLYGTTSKIRIIDRSNCLINSSSTNLNNCRSKISTKQNQLNCQSPLNSDHLKSVFSSANNSFFSNNLPSTSAHSTIISNSSSKALNKTANVNNVTTALHLNAETSTDVLKNNSINLANYSSNTLSENLNLESVRFPELYKEANNNENYTLPESYLISDFDTLASRYDSMFIQRENSLRNNSLKNVTSSRVPNNSNQQSYNGSSSSTYYTHANNISNNGLNALLDSTTLTSSNSISLFTSPHSGTTATKSDMSKTTSDIENLTTATTAKRCDKLSARTNKSDNNFQRSSECSICMNNKVNAVIYRCGHMCMCFECANETYRRSGDCPICRSPIVDVIRCYPA